jgi:DNA repair exonuclease SbcCD ATPase subunit
MSPQAGRVHRGNPWIIASEDENTPPSATGLDSRETLDEKVKYVRHHLQKLNRECETERYTASQAIIEINEQFSNLRPKPLDDVTEEISKQWDELNERLAKLEGEVMDCELRQARFRAHLANLKAAYDDPRRHSYLEEVLMHEIVEDIKQG